MFANITLRAGLGSFLTDTGAAATLR